MQRPATWKEIGGSSLVQSQRTLTRPVFLDPNEWHLQGYRFTFTSKNADDLISDLCLGSSTEARRFRQLLETVPLPWRAARACARYLVSSSPRHLEAASPADVHGSWARLIRGCGFDQLRKSGATDADKGSGNCQIACVSSLCADYLGHSDRHGEIRLPFSISIGAWPPLPAMSDMDAGEFFPLAQIRYAQVCAHVAVPEDEGFVLCNAFVSAEFRWTSSVLTRDGREHMDKVETWHVPSLDLSVHSRTGHPPEDQRPRSRHCLETRAVDSWSTVRANRASKARAVAGTRNVLGRRCLYCLGLAGSFCYGCGVWDLLCCGACSGLVGERRVPELVAGAPPEETTTLCRLCCEYLDESFCRRLGAASTGRSVLVQTVPSLKGDKGQRRPPTARAARAVPHRRGYVSRVRNDKKSGVSRKANPDHPRNPFRCCARSLQ